MRVTPVGVRMRTVAMHVRAARMVVGGVGNRQREGLGMIAQVLDDALCDRDEKQAHGIELLVFCRHGQIGIEEWPLIEEGRLNRASHRGAGRVVKFSGMKHEVSARFDAGGKERRRGRGHRRDGWRWGHGHEARGELAGMQVGLINLHDLGEVAH